MMTQARPTPLHLLQADAGLSVGELASLASALAPTPDTIAQLCDIAQDGDHKLQSAATWLIKRLTEKGVAIPASPAERLINLLIAGAGWQARLHILQIIDKLQIPAERADALWHCLNGQLQGSNKFIRAWSYHGLAALANQHQAYRGRALILLERGEGDEAASVRARIRRIRKTGSFRSSIFQ